MDGRDWAYKKSLITFLMGLVDFEHEYKYHFDKCTVENWINDPNRFVLLLNKKQKDILQSYYDDDTRDALTDLARFMLMNYSWQQIASYLGAVRNRTVALYGSEYGEDDRYHIGDAMRRLSDEKCLAMCKKWIPKYAEL